jgi:hypothetical protein
MSFASARAADPRYAVLRDPVASIHYDYSIQLIASDSPHVIGLRDTASAKVRMKWGSVDVLFTT